MKFNTVQKNGYFLKFQEDTMPDSLAIHQFCGKHTISGAYCPNCEKPLLRFISFNLSDNKIKVGIRHGILHLLFCWTCNVAQDPFFYKIIGENEIEILEYEKGGIELDFPYENYPLYFPSLASSVLLMANSIWSAEWWFIILPPLGFLGAIRFLGLWRLA